MFNRSLATGLRPTITTVSVQPGVVSIQSRAKGTIKDPFEGEERKDEERVMEFLKKSKFEKLAPKFNSWEHLMEASRLILRHNMGLQSHKERRRFRKLVRMKKIEEYFCENKVYIPINQPNKRTFMHRGNKTDDTNNSKYSDDDMSFRVPADDRNMSATFTSMFYPHSTAKYDATEGPESMHQDVKETFMEGIMTHSADKDQLAKSWEMNTKLFEYVLTPEERRAQISEERRRTYMELTERAEQDIEKPFIPQDISSRDFVHRVTDLILKGRPVSNICEIYYANYPNYDHQPVPVEINGITSLKEVIATSAGPMDVRSDDSVYNRVEEIYKAIITSTLKKKYETAKKNIYVPDKLLAMALLNFEKYVGELTKKSAAPISSQVTQLIAEFSTQYPHADFIRDQFLLSRSPSYGDTSRNLPDLLKPLTEIQRGALEDTIITRAYEATVRGDMEVAVAKKEVHGIPLETEPREFNANPLEFATLDRDATEEQRDAFQKRLEAFSEWLEKYDASSGNAIRSAYLTDFPTRENISLKTARELVRMYRHVVFDGGSFTSTAFSALETPEFHAEYVGTGGANALNDLVVARNQNHEGPMDHNLMFPSPLNTRGMSGAPFDSGNPLPKIAQFVPERALFNVEDDFSSTEEEPVEHDIKSFKLADYFSDLEEFKANHPMPAGLDRVHKAFLYGYDMHSSDPFNPRDPMAESGPGNYKPGNAMYDDYNYHFEHEFLKPIAEYHANRSLYIEKSVHQRVSAAQDDINSLIDNLEAMHIEASRRGNIDAVNAAARRNALKK